MPVNLRDLWAKSRTWSKDTVACDDEFWNSVRYYAKNGDLLSYILYVHGPKHPDIRSFSLSMHGFVMATLMESSLHSLINAHPESGKTLAHRSEMEQWIGMETERAFAVDEQGRPKYPDAAPPSAAYIMGTLVNQAEPQVHDIRNTIEFNRRYRELFPHARPDKKEGWEKGKFFLKRPPEKTRPEATLIAMGCEGDIQGSRYGKITVDDPISQQDAKSTKIVRDRVAWILGTLERRLLEAGVLRYVFTRWHERDAFEPLSKICDTLVMPVYDFWEKHPEHGFSSDTLWPDKWPKARVEEERSKLVDAGFGYLFPLVWLCSPKQAEGTTFKREWFRYGAQPDDLFIVQAVDPAIGETDRADFFAVATVGWSQKTRRFYVLDTYRTRREAPEQPALVREQYDLWKPAYVGLESIFYQHSLFQYLRVEGNVPLRKIDRRFGSQDANKMMRISGLAERYKMEQVLHPEPAPPWLREFEEELCDIDFSQSLKGTHAHDDMADAVAMAVDLLRPRTIAEAPTEPTMIPVVIGS